MKFSQSSFVYFNFPLQEAIRRLHAAGKFVAVHIDGMLRGALGMIRHRRRLLRCHHADADG